MRLSFGWTAMLAGAVLPLAACSGGEEAAAPKGDAVALNAMEAEGTISDAMIQPETILSEGPVDLSPDPAVAARQKALDAAREAAADDDDEGAGLFAGETPGAARRDRTPTDMDRAIEEADRPLPPIDDGGDAADE